MLKLNLPAYNFSFKNKENKTLIFDSIRKKYVVLTPEEWVRQHFINYLIQVKNYPISLIAVEKQLIINGLKKRFDILIFNKTGNPFLIVECKAPNVEINQQSFDQISQYNFTLRAAILVITNGMNHYCYRLDQTDEKYVFLNEIPSF